MDGLVRASKGNDPIGVEPSFPTRQIWVCAMWAQVEAWIVLTRPCCSSQVSGEATEMTESTRATPPCLVKYEYSDGNLMLVFLYEPQANQKCCSIHPFHDLFSARSILRPIPWTRQFLEIEIPPKQRRTQVHSKDICPHDVT